jgi:5-methylcytosine-specific restriction protein A
VWHQLLEQWLSDPRMRARTDALLIETDVRPLVQADLEAATMPDAFASYCADPTCHAKTSAGRYCEAHTRVVRQQYERGRGSAHARGYGRRWERYVARFKALYPLCGDRPPGARQTSDSVCQAQGLEMPMYVVDHITPVKGPDDPLFYRRENHQALCERCHNMKRRRERGPHP